MTTPLPIELTDGPLPPSMDSRLQPVPSRKKKRRVGGSSSTSLSRVPSKPKSKLKKFTYAEIETKVSERKHIPEYRSVLMECALEQDHDGIWFDLKHPAWERLIKLVKSRNRRPQRTIAAPSTRPPQPPSVRERIDSDRESLEERERPQHRVSRRIQSALDTASHQSIDLVDVIPVVRRKAKKKVVKEKTDQEWLDILTEQLSSYTPNRRAVRDACRVVGIPTHFRAQIWKILLGAHARKIELAARSSSNSGGAPATTRTDETDETATATTAAAAVAEDEEQNGQMAVPIRRSRKNKKRRRKSSRDDPMATTALTTEWHPLPSYPPSPLPNQRTIIADIERTRPNLEVFQDEFNRQKMEIILTEYCRRKKVSYKQGMNYVLAPFLLVEMKDMTDIYLSFEMFIESFLKSTFVDDEFGSLQCIFRLTNVLLQYHDPELAHYFSWSMDPPLIPELYATGWFTTLHANKVDPDTLLWLWDRILLHDFGPCIPYFVGIELLRLHRAPILEKTYDVLLPFLSNLVIDDRDEARRLLHHGDKTIAMTPLSFYNLLHKCATTSVLQDTPLYHDIQKMKCMAITPMELIAHVTNNVAMLYKNHANKSTMVLHDHLTSDLSSASNSSNSSSSFSHSVLNKIATRTKRNRQPQSMSAPELHSPNVATDEHQDQSAFLTSSSSLPSSSRTAKYFVLDCRPVSQYNSGHLPCCFHLDPSSSRDAMEEQILEFCSWKSCHFVLLLDGLDNPRDDELVSWLIEKFCESKCKYVSMCDGGYHACHSYMSNQDQRVSNDVFFEFVDHESRTCVECNGAWRRMSAENKKSRVRAARREQAQHQNGTSSNLDPDSGLLSSMRGRLATLVSAVAENRTFGGSNRSDTASGSNLAPNVNVLSPTAHVRVCLTLLRDRNTESEQFRSVTHVILHLLFGDLLEQLPFACVTIHTPYDIPTNGFRCERSVYGITLDSVQGNHESESSHEHTASSGLKEVLFTYFPCCNSVIDTMSIEETFVHDDDDGVLRSTRNITLTAAPPDIAKRLVIVFVPVLSLASEVATAIGTLVDHGAQLKWTVIMSLVASRNAIDYIVEHFSQVHIWCAAVDDVEAMRISPGIGTFKHRYRTTTTTTAATSAATTATTATTENGHHDAPPPTIADADDGQRESLNLDDADVASVVSVEDD